MCLMDLNAHPALADSAFYTYCLYVLILQFKFIAEVHYEVMKLLTY